MNAHQLLSSTYISFIISVHGQCAPSFPNWTYEKNNLHISKPSPDKSGKKHGDICVQINNNQPMFSQGKAISKPFESVRGCPVQGPSPWTCSRPSVPSDSTCHPVRWGPFGQLLGLSCGIQRTRYSRGFRSNKHSWEGNYCGTWERIHVGFRDFTTFHWLWRSDASEIGHVNERSELTNLGKTMPFLPPMTGNGKQHTTQRMVCIFHSFSHMPYSNYLSIK